MPRSLTGLASGRLRLRVLAAAGAVLGLLLIASWAATGANAPRSDRLFTPQQQMSPTSSQPTDPAPAPLPRHAEPLDLPAAALDMTWKLVVVLGLAYLLLAGLRRYTLGLGFVRQRSSLQVLEAVGLGPNRALYIVRAGNTRLLLGATAAQISTLLRWEGESPLPPDDQPTARPGIPDLPTAYR
jgi:flagellar biogenesis protein FliO